MNPTGTSLPPGWTFRRLDDFAETSSGGTPSRGRAEFYGGAIPWVKSGELPDGLVRATEETITELGLKSSSAKLFPKGTLCIALYGATVGKLGILDMDAATNQAVCGIFLPPDIDAKYLYWFLRLSRPSLIEQGKGGAQPNISQQIVRSISVPLAPPEQRTAILEEIEKQSSRVDAGVAALERVRANLKRYRASVLKAACEGRLIPTEAELARRESGDYEPASILLQRILKERRAHWEASELAKLKAKGKPPTDDRWKARYKEAEAFDTTKLPKLPEGWCWATTDMVGDILLGRQRAPQYLTGKWTRPYLRVANVKDDRVDLSDIETMDFDPVHFAQYRLLPGDILISEGQSPELVGQSAIYQGGIDGLCFQKTLHRFRRMPHGPTPEFAQIVFRAHVKTGFFQKVASITTNIAHLTLEKFKASPFPLPPIAEQVRITAEVKRRTSLADHLQEALSANAAGADCLRQSILASAFQGRLTGTLDRSGAEARNPANASARPLRGSLSDEAFADA